MSLSLKRKPSTLDMCVHTSTLHLHTQHQGVSCSTQAFSSLTELNSGTCTWNSRIPREPCGKRVCGQWQLDWLAITGLTAWLRDICSILIHHCGPQPTNSCVFKDTQLLWASLHSSRLLSCHFKCSLPSTPPHYAAATHTHFSPNLEATLKKWVGL